MSYSNCISWGQISEIARLSQGIYITLKYSAVLVISYQCINAGAALSATSGGNMIDWSGLARTSGNIHCQLMDHPAEHHERDCLQQHCVINMLFGPCCSYFEAAISQ